MYTAGIFLFLAVVDMFLTWYGVVEKGSDYYKDLVSLVIATLITVYLSLASVSGTVILTTSMSLNDMGLMWLGFLIAAAQVYITLMEYLEAREERANEKRDRLLSPDMRGPI